MTLNRDQELESIMLQWSRDYHKKAATRGAFEKIHWMMRKRCRDEQCVRRLPHRNYAQHLTIHKFVGPEDPQRWSWMCEDCGHRRGHRVHRTAGS